MKIGSDPSDVNNFVSLEKFTDHILLQRGPWNVVVGVENKQQRIGSKTEHQLNMAAFVFQACADGSMPGISFACRTMLLMPIVETLPTEYSLNFEHMASSRKVGKQPS
jgi:hypothetical protein